jgi:TPR repeat protein
MVSKLWATGLIAAATFFALPASAQTSDVGRTTNTFDSRLTMAEWDHGDINNLLRLSDTANRRAELESMAAAGDMDATALSGMAWLAGAWGSVDTQRGFELLRAAADKGHPRAMAVVGQLLWEGTLVSKNQAEALQWVRKAAVAGNGVAQTDLAVFIINKQAEAAANDEALNMMRQAADKGVSWAMRFMGDIYFNGAGVAKDDRAARDWHQKAARLGDNNALAAAGALAWTAEREPSVSKFLGFAKVELAAQSGDVDAIVIAARAYLGQTIHLNLVDPPAALALLESARASVGKTNVQINALLPVAQNAVAQMRRNGDKKGINQIRIRTANGGIRPIDMTDKEIVDKIAVVPAAWPDGIPEPVLPSLPGDRSPVDEWGVSEREWREMNADQFTTFAMLPSVIARIAQGYAKRDPKALTLIAMVAKSSYGSLNTDYGYPQCRNASAAPSYCGGLANRLSDYLNAAGIGGGAANRDGLRIASEYPGAIARFLRGKPSMRAQLEAGLQFGLYNDQQMGRMLVFADLGYLPAIQNMAARSAGCSGDADVRRFAASQGRSERGFVEAAMALGDVRIGFEFAQKLRGGLCIGRDEAGAANMFRAAADMGNIDAKYELMQMYAGYSPGNFSRNYRKALTLALELEKQMGEPVNPRLMAQIREGAANETKLRAAIGEVTDDPSKPPNAATIRAAIMRELRWTMNRFSGLSFMSLIGNPPIESWNFDDGSFLFETQNPGDMFGIYFRNDLFVNGAGCKAAAGQARAYDCSYLMSGTLDWKFGKVTLFNGSSGTPVRQQHRFEFVDGQWRSTSVRANIMANMNTNGIGASGASNGRNGFCKSLYAGVVAVGGSSPNKGLDPNTWGC